MNHPIAARLILNPRWNTYLTDWLNRITITPPLLDYTYLQNESMWFYCFVLKYHKEKCFGTLKDAHEVPTLFLASCIGIK